MPAYDPKRPRPAESFDAPAPVDALLDSTIADSDVPVVDVRGPSPELRGPGNNGHVRHAGVVPEAPAGQTSEVPVAPAPQVGTVNRAVLVASITVSVALVALLVWLGFRRRS
jgi:hypothetical protein